MYFLKIVGLELLYWILGQVEGILHIIIIVAYSVLLVLIITPLPEPYIYYAGSAGFTIGIVLSFKFPDISTWTLDKKEKLKEERDKLKQINNK